MCFVPALLNVAIVLEVELSPCVVVVINDDVDVVGINVVDRVASAGEDNVKHLTIRFEKYDFAVCFHFIFISY